MANQINPNFNYTYDGDLTLDVLVKPAVMAPNTTSLFRVEDSIKYKRQLSLTNPLGKILQGEQGCGVPSVTSSGVQITNRTLETCPGEFYIEQCSDTFEATILANATRAGIDFYNLQGTQLGNLLNRLVVEALQRDVFRIASFGDTTSPAGDPSYYGWCDGLWTRLFAGEASYDVTGVDTSISALNQTSGTRAIDYFQNLWTGAKRILKQLPADQKKFYVTGNVFENYILNLQNIEQSNGGFLITTQEGITRAFYQGIEVVPFWAWDEHIEADNLGNNTRILYTTPDNHVIGIDSQSELFSADFWYYKRERKNILEGRLRIGYNYVHDELQAISYGNV